VSIFFRAFSNMPFCWDSLVVLLALSLFFVPVSCGRFTPDWTSLDSRPLPSWFDDAKFGIFVHWGVFSVPSFKTEWYWWNLNGPYPDPETVLFHNRVYGSRFRYADFAQQFTAEMFDPAAWARMFREAGARYVVLTSKHHEGFTNWPSNVSWNWNAHDVGPHRDLVGELTDAVRKTNLRMGLYHSLYEWFHPLYLQDKASGFATRTFPEQKTLPELRELVMQYQPDVIWSDGDLDADSDYWGSREFLAWLYNDSPVNNTVVTNDRWGKGCFMKHGGFHTGWDRQSPGPSLLGHKWESCMTIDRDTWGYSRRSTLQDYLSTTEILHQLISTVAYGGNLLLNVGPTKDGLILPIFEERLSQLGAFLRINGAAVYSTVPFAVQEEPGVSGGYYTAPRNGCYVFLTVVPPTGVWPTPGTPLLLTALANVTAADLLTAKGPMAVVCAVSHGEVACQAPCPFAAGLATAAVHPLGFALRLTIPTIRTRPAKPVTQ